LVEMTVRVTGMVGTIWNVISLKDQRLRILIIPEISSRDARRAGLEDNLNEP
jgi:hypothetical protein